MEFGGPAGPVGTDTSARATGPVIIEKFLRK